MKKILSVFLVIAMCFSLMPAGAFAEEVPAEEELIAEASAAEDEKENRSDDDPGEAAPEPEEAPAPEETEPVRAPEATEASAAPEEETLQTGGESTAYVTTGLDFVIAVENGDEIQIQNDITVTPADLADYGVESLENLSGFALGDGHTVTFDGVDLCGCRIEVRGGAEAQVSTLSLVNGASFSPLDLIIGEGGVVQCENLTLSETAHADVRGVLSVSDQFVNRGSARFNTGANVTVSGKLTNSGSIDVSGNAVLSVGSYDSSTANGTIKLDAGKGAVINGIEKKHIRVCCELAEGNEISYSTVTALSSLYAGYEGISVMPEGDCSVSGAVTIPSNMSVHLDDKVSGEGVKGTTVRIPSGAKLTVLGLISVSGNSSINVEDGGALYAFNMHLSGTLNIAEYAEAYLFEGISRSGNIKTDGGTIEGYYEKSLSVGLAETTELVYSGYDVYLYTAEESGYYLIEGTGEEYSSIGCSTAARIYDRGNATELVYIPEGEAVRIRLYAAGGKNPVPLGLKITKVDDIENLFIEKATNYGSQLDLYENLTVTAGMLPQGSGGLNIRSGISLHGATLSIDKDIPVLLESGICLYDGSALSAGCVDARACISIQGECAIDLDGITGNSIYLEKDFENKVSYTGAVGKESVMINWPCSGGEITRSGMDEANGYASANGYCGVQFVVRSDAFFSGTAINIKCGFLLENNRSAETEEDRITTVTVPSGCTVNCFGCLYQDPGSKLIIEGVLNNYGGYTINPDRLTIKEGGTLNESFPLDTGRNEVYSAGACYSFTPGADGFYLFRGEPAEGKLSDYESYGISLIDSAADSSLLENWIVSAGNSLTARLEEGKSYDLSLSCGRPGSLHLLDISEIIPPEEFNLAGGGITAVTDTSATAGLSFTAPDKLPEKYGTEYSVGFLVSPADGDAPGGEIRLNDNYEFYCSAHRADAPAEGEQLELVLDRLVPGANYVCLAAIRLFNGETQDYEFILADEPLQFTTGEELPGHIPDLDFNDDGIASAILPDTSAAPAVYRCSIPTGDYAEMYSAGLTGEEGTLWVYDSKGCVLPVDVDGYDFRGEDIYIFARGEGETLRVEAKRNVPGVAVRVRIPESESDKEIISDKSASARTFTIIPGGALSKGSYKYVSSDTKVAGVTVLADGSARITIPANAFGACTVTVSSVKCPDKEATVIPVTIRNYTPRIGNSAFTLNPVPEDSSVSTVFVTGYGREIASVKLTTSAGLPIEGIDVSCDEGMLTLFCTDPNLAAKTYKNALLTAFDGEGNQLGDPVKVTLTIKPALPAVTVKQSGKVNTFYTDATGVLKLASKGHTIGAVELAAEHGAYEIKSFNPEDGSLVFGLKNGYSAESVKSGMSLKVSIEGYKVPVTVRLKSVSVASVKPTLAASPSSGTVNINLPDKTCSFRVINKTTGETEDLAGAEISSTTGGASAVIDGNRVVVTPGEILGKFSSGTVTVKVRKENRTSAISVKFTVKVTDLAAVTLGSSTLTLNNVFTESKTGTDMTVASNCGGVERISSYAFTGGTGSAEAAKIGLSLDAGRLVAQIKDPDDAPKAGSYKFTVYTVSKENLQLKPVTVTVRVVSTVPKVTLGAGSAKLNARYSGSESFTTPVRMTAAGYTLTGFLYVNSNVDAGYENGKLSVALKPGAESTTVELTPVLKNDETGQEINLSALKLKLTVYDKQATVKTTASGKLDTLVREKGITYTPKFANWLGDFEEARLASVSEDFFRVEAGTNDKGAKVAVVRLKEDSAVRKGTYSFKLEFRLSGTDEWVSTPVIKAAVTRSTLRLKVSSSQVLYQSLGNGTELCYELKVTAPAGAKIETVSVGTLTGALKTAFDELSPEEQADGSLKLTVSFKNVNALKKGTTCQIPVTVMPVDAAAGTAPVKATLSFRVVA